ncbi:hypothetical protein AX774_g3843 [Zancudomyces culisetae]|uniref:Uncharacterized protein n=1 Tax=Zancudomyces culisetae TaxID=1213189 RepID=A0A1R1PNW0_ZANCU|nr:hypothetical protein AX774_g3843 [Zancudomyces culisetae]|eukprot:OMH82665.1 hypothetical protein AX774_g3843 [Zancudomyces culisetae]
MTLTYQFVCLFSKSVSKNVVDVVQSRPLSPFGVSKVSGAFVDFSIIRKLYAQQLRFLVLQKKRFSLSG